MNCSNVHVSIVPFTISSRCLHAVWLPQNRRVSGGWCQMSHVIRFSVGEPSCCIFRTLCIRSIILIYWWINITFWPSKDTNMGHNRRPSLCLNIIKVFAFPLLAGQWVRGQQGMLGYGNSEELTRSHTSKRMQRCSDVSGWSKWAETVVPELTLEGDTGNEEPGPLSCVITAHRLESVCLCTKVCVSMKRTDWLIVNPTGVCMICPILHPATLCKQYFSGPEESRWQEVLSSWCEEDGWKVTKNGGAGWTSFFGQNYTI